MNKDWLHLPSLGRTIDFNVVSDIQWNEKSVYDKRFRTLVYLGTSIAIGEESGIERPHLSIFDDEDRKKLYAKFPGIPIDLLFNEAPLSSEALFNKDEIGKGKEAPDTDPIPF
jgi:hypothetical protein